MLLAKQFYRKHDAPSLEVILPHTLKRQASHLLSCVSRLGYHSPPVLQAVLCMLVPGTPRAALPILFQLCLTMPGMVKSDDTRVESYQRSQVEVISKRLHVGKHLAAA